MLTSSLVAAAFAASASLAHSQPTGVAPSASRGPAGGPTEATVYVGRERNVHVRPPRIDASPAVDGRLDEPEWARAAVLTGFSQFAPSDGVPAADSTQVLVWYSPTAIHFGVRAFEAHGAVKPNLADRDHIGAEDRVEILLGTFNDGRQALDFQVNPLGVQADGTLVEQGASGGGTSAGGRSLPDLSADFVFQSRGRVTDYGYEVEVRIPFKSLRYQSSDVQSWGLSLVRHVQHSGYDDSWTPASRSGASFLAQGGTLDGLTDLRRGLVLDLNPEVTQSVVGTPRAGGYDYASGRPSLGGNVRWGVTNTLTLNGTVKPDFSQVESDAGQLTYDPRNALFFAERRPFFLDGIEQFAVPSNLVYTRQIVQPEGAVKLTGKVKGTSVALLSAVDDAAYSRARERARPLFNILRVQRDVGAGSRVGLLYTDKEDGPGHNRVAGVDGRVLRGVYSAVAQVAASTTESPVTGARLDGPLWGARVERGGRRFGTTLQLSGVDPDFRTQSGFISRPGLVNGSLTQRYTHLGANGSRFENVTGTVGLLPTWQYRTFTRRGDAQDKKLHFDLGTQLRGGWTASAGFYLETFGYDRAFYGDRRVQLADGTTVPFVGLSDITNHDYLVKVGTPQWSKLSANVFYLWGQDENFFEWASAEIVLADASVDWRPTTQLRVSGEYQRQDYRRRTDNSTVGLTQIPRVKIEYQVSRPIFVRLVTEYVADRTDALRDDAGSGGPLLFPDGSGGYVAQGPTASNRLRLQGLFSYQPVPGTVFFAGYGSLLDEPHALRFTRFTRQSDGFFVKLSYLFRAN